MLSLIASAAIVFSLLAFVFWLAEDHRVIFWSIVICLGGFGLYVWYVVHDGAANVPYVTSLVIVSVLAVAFEQDGLAAGALLLAFVLAGVG